MRDELSKKWDVKRAGELTVEEVEGLYEQRAISTAHLSKMVVDVPFPIHSTRTSELDNDMSADWETIMDVNFGEGGSFMTDPELDPQFSLTCWRCFHHWYDLNQRLEQIGRMIQRFMVVYLQYILIFRRNSELMMATGC